MKELLIIAIGSAIVNNVVLSQFLGICPFLGVSKKPNWKSISFNDVGEVLVTIFSGICGASGNCVIHN